MMKVGIGFALILSFVLLVVFVTMGIRYVALHSVGTEIKEAGVKEGELRVWTGSHWEPFEDEQRAEVFMLNKGTCFAHARAQGGSVVIMFQARKNGNCYLSDEFGFYKQIGEEGTK